MIDCLGLGLPLKARVVRVNFFCLKNKMKMVEFLLGKELTKFPKIKAKAH